jgi:AAT family amino acid transporter
MDDPQYAATATATAAPEPSITIPTGGQVRQAAATLLIVAVLSLATWWLFIDPRWGVVAVYGNPANAVIFWTLFAIICLAFNLELKGFDRLGQPLRGLVFAAVAIAAGIGITALLALVWGAVDPSFAPERAGGVGYFAGAIFVLFVFLTNVPAATVFEHRPWKALGLGQPWVGIAEIAVSTIASLVLYAVFALPALAVWSTVRNAPLSVNEVVGFFYSIVVSIVVTSNLTDNRPWNRIGGSGRWFLLTAVGNVAVGTSLFFVLSAATRLLLGADARAAIGPDGLSIFPAQLGVCWVFWTIFWANCAGNRPQHLTPARNRTLRVLITLALAVLTFTVYYRVVAAHILHEPTLAPGIAGNALGFMDLAIVWLLLFAVGAESWPLARHHNTP